MIVDEVIGMVLLSPPIFRMSCSFSKLWINDPEHRNSRALKKECVAIWRKASVGWFSPTIVIIRPSWLVVDSAIIFLMSCWVAAAAAANIVVVAPRIKQMVVASSFFCIIG